MNKFLLGTIITVTYVFGSANAYAWNPNLYGEVQETIQLFIESNDKFQAYFDESYAFAVFPSVGKGGIVVGGAHGRGLVYEKGDYIGKAEMTQVSIGFQWGGQAYREVIFFEDEAALDNFINGNLKLSGQASAVAITKGASADLAYEGGIAVFTQARGGLMYEASVGGQKFSFKPDSKPEKEGSTDDE